MSRQVLKNSSLIGLSLLSAAYGFAEEKEAQELSFIPAVREKSISIVKNLASRVQDLIFQIEALHTRLVAMEKMNISSEIDALHSKIQAIEEGEHASEKQTILEQGIEKIGRELAQVKEQVAALKGEQVDSVALQKLVGSLVLHIQSAQNQISTIQTTIEQTSSQEELRLLAGQVQAAQTDLKLLAAQLQETPTASSLRQLTAQVNSVQNQIQGVKQEMDHPKDERVLLENATTRGRYGVFATAEWLYWKLYEGGTDYATEYASNSSYKKGRNKSIDFDFESGFRVGLGYVFKRDAWDLYGFYTQIDSTAKESVKGCVFPLLVFEDSLGGIDNEEAAKMHWNVHFKNGDLDLGREYFVGKWLTFHPGIGVKGAWIDQKAHAKYGFCDASEIPSSSSSCIDCCCCSSSSSSSSTSLSSSSCSPSCSCSCSSSSSEQTVYSVHLKNNFTGVGPKASLGTNWFFCPTFSLYGYVAGSVLWGEFDLKQSQRYFGDTHSSIKSTFNRLVPTAQVRLGLLWDIFFNRNRTHIGLSLGWEMQYWWRQNQIERYTDIRRPIYVRTSEDLSMQGVTLGARYDF